MTIRPATLADVPALVAMGERFRADSPYRDLCAENADAMAATCTRLITGPDSIMLVAEHAAGLVGMIGLILFAHHFSGARTAGELVWWVDPGARGTGLRLLRQGERWAAEAGATQMQMIAPDARVGRLYEHQGYAPVELTYQKALAPPAPTRPGGNGGTP